MRLVSALDVPLSLRLPKKTAKALEGAGVATVGDLLMVAPRRYYHWGRLTPLSSLREGEDVTILAEVAGAHRVSSLRASRSSLPARSAPTAANSSSPTPPSRV